MISTINLVQTEVSASEGRNFEKSMTTICWPHSSHSNIMDNKSYPLRAIAESSATAAIQERTAGVRREASELAETCDQISDEAARVSTQCAAGLSREEQERLILPVAEEEVEREVSNLQRRTQDLADEIAVLQQRPNLLPHAAQ
jgi:hypothetical protein